MKDIVSTSLDNYALSEKENIQKDTTDILKQQDNIIDTLPTGDAK